MLPPLVGLVGVVGPKKCAVSLMPNVVTTATANTGMYVVSVVAPMQPWNVQSSPTV